jgi:hypothetical protein
MNYELWIMDYGLWIMDYGLWMGTRVAVTIFVFIIKLVKFIINLQNVSLLVIFLVCFQLVC